MGEHFGRHPGRLRLPNLLFGFELSVPGLRVVVLVAWKRLAIENRDREVTHCGHWIISQWLDERACRRIVLSEDDRGLPTAVPVRTRQAGLHSVESQRNSLRIGHEVLADGHRIVRRGGNELAK